MDVNCGYCGEPWESYSTYARSKTVECSECDGTGVKETRHWEAADPDNDGLICTYSLEPQTCDECNGEGKTPCDCVEGYIGEEDEPWDSLTCPDCNGDETLECQECNGRGYFNETCGTCGQEIDQAPSPFYTVCLSDQCWIGDGDILCGECAHKAGLIVGERPCSACNGTGQITEQEETDLGNHEDIARFNAGEGCPCCGWGTYVLTECELCRSRGWTPRWRKACQEDAYLGTERCGGNLRPVEPSDELTETLLRAKVARELGLEHGE